MCSSDLQNVLSAPSNKQQDLGSIDAAHGNLVPPLTPKPVSQNVPSGVFDLKSKAVGLVTKVISFFVSCICISITSVKEFSVSFLPKLGTVEVETIPVHPPCRCTLNTENVNTPHLHTLERLIEAQLNVLDISSLQIGRAHV